MKRFVLITACLLLICGAVFYFVSVPRNLSSLTTVNGVFDTTGQSFKNTIFQLNGEWEFYNNRLYTPEDFVMGKPEGGTTITTPKTRFEFDISPYGFATYRLTFITDEPELLMFIPEIGDAGVVWVNEIIVYEAGKPGRTGAETVPCVRNLFASLPLDNGRAEIVMQMTNFGWRTFLPQYSIEIGRPPPSRC